ncbi:MAG: hypothetical protein CR986_08060 [Ignavibacteriae bacterium]|nr:MAG: hypothetical protein CR986_08060 [Ignavibacteriota bacterium]
MKKQFQFFLLVFILFSTFCVNAQWVEISVGINNWDTPQGAIDACDKNSIAFIAHNNEWLVYYSKDGGKNWLISTPLKDKQGSLVDISIIDSSNIWVVSTEGRILKSSDGTKTWETQFYDTTVTKFMNYIEMFDSQNGVAMGDAPNDSADSKAAFLRTADGGKTWTLMENDIKIWASGDTWRRIDFVNSEVGYFYEYFGNRPLKGIYKSMNGGNNWSKTSLDSSALTVLKFFDENIGLAVIGLASKNKVMRTIDGGKTWTESVVQNLAWGNDIEFLPNDPSKVWFTDYDNLFYSNDTGKTWVKQNFTPPAKMRDIVFTDSANGWIICDNAVYHTTNNGGYATNIVDNKSTISNTFKLNQNYPNPFNPETTIEYTIPSSLKGKILNVKLTVYNVLGKKIKTLVNKNQTSGNYSIKFNAENLPSGIYFYRLQVNNFNQVRKMLLLK